MAMAVICVSRKSKRIPLDTAAEVVTTMSVKAVAKRIHKRLQEDQLDRNTKTVVNPSVSYVIHVLKLGKNHQCHVATKEIPWSCPIILTATTKMVGAVIVARKANQERGGSVSTAKMTTASNVVLKRTVAQVAAKNFDSTGVHHQFILDRMLLNAT